MDVPEWVKLWGPALPICWLLYGLLRELVTVQIPKGFADIASKMEEQINEAGQRHIEHMGMQQKVLGELKRVKKRCGKCACKQPTKKITPTKR